MSDDAPEAVPWDMLRGAMVTRTVAVVAHLLVLDSVVPSATIRTVRSGSTCSC